MSYEEYEVLVKVQQYAYKKVEEKYGPEKVKQVDDLGAETTLKMAQGEKVPGIEDWMYDVLNDFQGFILEHPNVKIPVH